MSQKTYGAFVRDAPGKRLIITAAEPHVSIRLKQIFPRIPKGARPPYQFADTLQNCADLSWFMDRYPLRGDQDDLLAVGEGKRHYTESINTLEAIVSPDYVAKVITLKDGYVPRDYQVQAAAVHLRVKRLLLGDEMGLGKSLTAILSLLHTPTLPAAVVVQTHMTKQWKEEAIEKFTNLRVHIIKGTKPYDLPEADVYIFKYSNIGGWCNYFDEKYFRSAIFDEVQELRRDGTLKYEGAKSLSESVNYTIGLSGTPIYNLGDEMFHVLDVLNPDCLGTKPDFLREWCVPMGGNYRVQYPAALGTFLRENFLFLRRTRSDVGRALPPLNTIVHTVEYDEATVKKSEGHARELAMRITTGTFTERGEAARELDMLARYTTGMAKVRGVAAYVRLLLEAGEPVVLGAWHRDFYDVLLEELKDFNPVMYTGSESEKQKNEAKRAFLAGETNLFIISLRSGAGLDGLQQRCRTVVIAELDYSPQIHNQLIARVDRDGQTEQVLVVFLVSETGSDQVITNLLGLKASQSHGILDPLKPVTQQYSDESRIKLLAAAYLKKST